MFNPFKPRKVQLTQPQAWTVFAALEIIFALYGWLEGQGITVAAGILGAVCAIGARWYVAHPVIEYIEVYPEEEYPEELAPEEAKS